MSVSISGYKVISKLGEGGMGAVFKAKHEMTGREVAIKVLPPKLAKDETFRKRFLREARAAAAFNHPNITKVYDAGEQSGLYYMVMEYVEGESIANIIRATRPLKAEYALSVAREVAEGLAHAHAEGIIHRDIKPDNIMLNLERVVKITDMGLAKRVEAATDDAADVTLAGTILGTPKYMSPEQIMHPDTIDHRADIYSLGATLYFILTGRPPFDGESAPEIMVKVLKETPRYPKNLPRPVVRLLKTLLAKKPQNRPQNAEDAAALIGETLEELRHPSPGLPQRSRETAYVRSAEKSRTGLVIALLGIAAVIAIVLAVAFGTGKNGEPDSGDTVSGDLTERPSPKPPVAPPMPAPEKDMGKAAYERALAFARRNPDLWGECIAAFRRVVKEYPAYATVAQAEIEKILSAARREREKLFTEALKLENAGRLQEALDVLNSLAGRFNFLEDSGEIASALQRLKDRLALLGKLKDATTIFYCDFTPRIVKRNVKYTLNNCQRVLCEADNQCVVLSGDRASVKLILPPVGLSAHLYLRITSIPVQDVLKKTTVAAFAGEKELTRLFAVTEDKVEAQYFDIGEITLSRGCDLRISAANSTECRILRLEAVSPLGSREQTLVRIPPPVVEFEDALVLFKTTAPLIRDYDFKGASEACQRAYRDPQLEPIRSYIERERTDIKVLSGLWNLFKEKLTHAASQKSGLSLQFLDGTRVTGSIIIEDEKLLIKGKKTYIVEPSTLHPDSIVTHSGLSESEAQHQVTLTLLYAYASFHPKARELFENAKGVLSPEDREFYRKKLAFLKEKYPSPEKTRPRVYLTWDKVILLVLDADNLEPVEKGLLDLLKKIGITPRLADVSSVRTRKTRLTDYRAVIVGSYSPENVKSAYSSEQVKKEIEESLKGGTTYILLQSGCYVLEILDLATTMVLHWNPTEPVSYFLVKPLVDSNIAKEVPAMPNFPGGIGWNALETQMFDSLIWRVTSRAGLYYRLLRVAPEAYKKQPLYLFEVGSAYGVRRGMIPPTAPHLALSQTKGGKLLDFGLFWNVDPGNGGGGTVGKAGEKLLYNAIACALANDWELEEVTSLPYDAQLWIEISHDLRKAHRIEEAAKALLNALKLAPDSKQLASGAASTLTWLQDCKQALEITKRALAKHKDDPDLLQTEALAMHFSKKYRTALRRIDASLKKESDSELSHLIRAGVLNMLKKTKEARKAALKFWQLEDPSFAPMHKSDKEFATQLKQAQQSVKSGEYGKAGMVALQLVATRPENASAYNLLGLVSTHLNEYADAKDLFTGAVLLNPRFAKAYINLGYVYLRLSEPDLALATLEAARKLRPSKEEKSALEQHLESAKQALKQRDTTAKSSYDEGKRLYSQRRPGEAVPKFRAAVSLKDSSPYWWLARCYHQLNQLRQAVLAYDKAILIKPEVKDNYYGKALVLRDQQQYEKAIESFKKCSELNRKSTGRDHYESWVGIADCYRKLGKTKEAAAAQRKAQQLRPKR